MTAGHGRRSSELVRAYSSFRGEGELFVACSPSAKLLVCEADRVARTSGPLLIRGETGTGKTLLARTLHLRHGRPATPLHIVNCAALPEALLSETIAGTHQGQAEQTVLLDEVGELSPFGQAVLSRALEARRRGASRTRFIAATHRDLDAMVAAGQFSRELLGELARTRIHLAPLRSRPDDIVPLALHFVRLALEVTQKPLVGVEDELLACLVRYAWPGNARELRNAMFGAVALNETGSLGLADLPESVRGEPARVSYL